MDPTPQGPDPGGVGLSDAEVFKVGIGNPARALKTTMNA